MQLIVLTCTGEIGPGQAIEALGKTLRAANVGAVLYEDVNDPFGIGLLSFSEDPADFVTKVRPSVVSPALAGVRLRPEFTMLGRSYSSGFEPDLEHWVLKRPRETVLNEMWPWAVWYPPAGGAFARSASRAGRHPAPEHGMIGRCTQRAIRP